MTSPPSGAAAQAATSSSPHSAPAPAACGHEHHHHGHGHHHDHHGCDAAVAPTRPDAPPGTLVSARGVTLARVGRTLVDRIDLDLAPGEILTLIGPNGAGKTTLVKLLLGLVRPDAGRIVRRPDLAVGYVPQRFDIDRSLPMTVARFVSIGTAVSPADVSRVLDEVGAGRLSERQLVVLSGGELQRVVLARALLRKPNLLALDEPARGVDAVGEAELYDLIGRIRDSRGLGVLLVSHDLHVVMARSDRVVCLNRHVCCSGVPETVAQHPEYVRLFGPQGAAALAVYHHHHDHAHDLAGAPVGATATGGTATGAAVTGVPGTGATDARMAKAGALHPDREPGP